MRAYCMTTINSPDHRHLNALTSDLSRLYVAGDTKTPHEEWELFASENPGVHFVDSELEERGLRDFAEKLGSGTYARKNLTFLAALQDGAKEIFELDDDNFLITAIRHPVSDATRCYRVGFDSIEDGGEVCSKRKYVPNTFGIIYGPSDLWFRGYPIENLGDQPRIEEVDPGYLHDVDVVNFAVLGEPDLDAIARLTSPEYRVKAGKFVPSAEFSSVNGSYLVCEEGFLPGNTQATLWLNMEKRDFLYHPKSVSMRFSDILKMYVCQTSCRFAYGGAAVHQVRNKHDFLLDFQSEVEMHLAIPKLLPQLAGFSGKTLVEVYALLASQRIVDESEVDVARDFVRLSAKAVGA